MWITPPPHNVVSDASSKEQACGREGRMDPSIVAADRLARALGTALLEMIAEVERESDISER
jgi:hypothetical protein